MAPLSPHSLPRAAGAQPRRTCLRAKRGIPLPRRTTSSRRRRVRGCSLPSSPASTARSTPFVIVLVVTRRNPSCNVMAKVEGGIAELSRLPHTWTTPLRSTTRPSPALSRRTSWGWGDRRSPTIPASSPCQVGPLSPTSGWAACHNHNPNSNLYSNLSHNRNLSLRPHRPSLSCRRTARARSSRSSGATTRSRRHRGISSTRLRTRSCSRTSAGPSTTRRSRRRWPLRPRSTPSAR